MQLNQIRYLLEVERYGSISKAAQEMYISQSTISLALMSLEEELGVTILNRSKRGVSFTTDGKLVAEKAKKIMDAVMDLQQLEFSRQEVYGTVSIGTNSHFATNLVTDAMIQIRNAFPQLTVSAQRNPLQDTIKKIAMKELDLGFVHMNSINQSDIMQLLHRSRLAFTPIFKDNLRICVGDNHPLLGKNKISVSELRPYEMATMPARADGGITAFLTEKGYDREPISINDLANLRKYVAKLNGFLVMPENEIENSNRTFCNHLYPLDIPEFDIECTMGWIHHEGHEMTLAESTVIDVLLRECQRYQDMNNQA